MKHASSRVDLLEMIPVAKIKDTAQQGFIRVAVVRRVKEEWAVSSNAKGKQNLTKSTSAIHAAASLSGGTL